MTVTARPDRRTDADRMERDLMARLGLRADATPEEIEEAHDRLIEFLERAPHALRRWAATEAAAADEAYALLSDIAALPAPPPTVAEPITFGSEGPEPAARRAARPEKASGTSIPAQDTDDLPDELLETEGAGMPVRRPKANIRPAAAATGPEGPASVRTGGRRRLVTRATIAVGALAAAIAIAVAGYNAGAPRVPGVSGTPVPESSSAAVQVDQAQVAALMQKITANPNDTASLLELGNLYFDAADYPTAAVFMSKVVAVDPNNVDGLVGLGASQFNTGDRPSAKQNWDKAVSLDPKNQEAFFDLGFWYLNQNPPDMANVVASWNRVIEIDPTGSFAKSVKTHLDAFASQSPAASAGAATAPSAGAATPAPAGSPAGTGN